MKLKLLIPMLALACYVRAQTADEIVTKYISKIGGAEKWKALKSIKATATLSIQGAELKAVMYKKPKTKIRAEIRVNGVDVISAYDGQVGWMLNPTMSKEPIKLDDVQAKEVMEEFEDEFIDYKKKGHEITLLGTEELDGIKCFKIQIVLNKNNPLDDETEIYFFDAETYLPALEIDKPAPGQTNETKRYIGDYREVNGLLFPFFEETKIGDQSLQKVTMDNIALNEPFEDSIFSFPKK